MQKSPNSKVCEFDAPFDLVAKTYHVATDRPPSEINLAVDEFWKLARKQFRSIYPKHGPGES